MLAKISSRSNSSSDVWRDGDDAVSPPALLCCAAVRESSSACAGDGVARAGDGGGVPSLERRRGEPSVEDGVTDRARRAAAACWRGSAALKDWVESSMVMPCFMSERRAQSVRVVLFNERDSGVSAARAFWDSCPELGGSARGGPATAGRVNSYCRPALAPGNRWLARRRGDFAASRDSVGSRLSPWLVPGPLSRGGAPQAAIHGRLRVLKPCLRSWPKNGPARIYEAADGSSDRSCQVSNGVTRRGAPLMVRVRACQPCMNRGNTHAKRRHHAAVNVQEPRIGRCTGVGDLAGTLLSDPRCHVNAPLSSGMTPLMRAAFHGACAVPGLPTLVAHTVHCRPAPTPRPVASSPRRSEHCG